MTERQIKQRWIDIKKLIKQRPLLAYLTGIPFKEWNTYMNNTPVQEEVDRIYNSIIDDRTEKTKRIRQELNSIVGYREAKQYSKKMGISDTTIREIVEGKKTAAGYGVIDRVEIFISAIDPNFEVSVENPLSKELLVKDEFDEIANEIRDISNSLLRESFELKDVAKKMRLNNDWGGRIIDPSSGIKYQISRLTSIKETIDLIVDTYIKEN